jgi:hypothetical protein
MALTRTPHDEIRAVLGVSDDELSDATLNLNMVSDQIELELSDISDTLPTALDAIVATPVLTRTAAQAKLASMAGLFCSYAAAKILLSSLPMFAAKRITDGRAEMERFADPFADIRAGVNSGYTALRLRLQTALAVVDTSFTATTVTVTPIFTVASPLAVDPVTGL